ncbi:hypothetical protein SBRCBS47491_004434 [Sporothrix bragantina]|uniref:Uncharacterized protein n=1 Tax=Sporothrix bragantina TaxID=671064 RepID=A0ABP0BNF5_9PEZI
MSSKFAGAMLVGCSVYLGGDTGYHSVDKDQEDIMPGLLYARHLDACLRAHALVARRKYDDVGPEVCAVGEVEPRRRHARHVIAGPDRDLAVDDQLARTHVNEGAAAALESIPFCPGLELDGTGLRDVTPGDVAKIRVWADYVVENGKMKAIVCKLLKAYFLDKGDLAEQIAESWSRANAELRTIPIGWSPEGRI